MLRQQVLVLWLEALQHKERTRGMLWSKVVLLQVCSSSVPLLLLV
jgi:hypothetical protein